MSDSQLKMADLEGQTRALKDLSLGNDDTEDWKTETGSSTDTSKHTDNENSTESKAVRHCGTCKKTSEDLGAPLLCCAKCQSAWYCNRDCQKQDWKTHKPACHKPGTMPPFQVHTVDPSDISSLLSDSALHTLPEKTVYNHLIDAYRLRVEDDYKFTGSISNDSLYGDGQPIKDFRRFLDMAEQRKGLLPGWWSAAKRKECEKVAVDRKAWSCLAFAVEKSDIQEHYGNPLMPMRLRVLAEKVYGRPVY